MRALVVAGLATAPLRRLIAGWAFAGVGSWAFMVALAVYAYGEGGATAVGLAAVVRMLPAGIAAPFAGLLADRLARRDVLVWVTAARTVVLAAIAAAVAAGVPFALVLVLATVFTVLQTAHRPAQAALLPHLCLNPTQLAAGNAVITGVDNGAFLFGSLLGGVLVAATSAQIGFAVCAGALALAAVALRAVPRDPVPEHRMSTSGVASELGEGIAGMRSNHGLRTVVAVLSVSTLAEGAIDVLVVVAALEIVFMGEAGVGWLNAAWGLGGLVGGGVALFLLRQNRLATGLAFGATAAGIPLVVLAGVPSEAVALGGLAVLGVGYAVMEIAGWTLLQRLASDYLLARTTGLLESAYWVTNGIGALSAPLIVSLVGGRWALAVVGVALPLVVVLRRAALARLESGHPVPERPFNVLRALPLFAPLPITVLESLALRVREVRADPGAAVITQGDPGDRFYAVCEGRLDVIRDAERCGEVEEGGFFGETALLHDAPRNATVTPVQPCLLYALDREVFLEAVTGCSRATEAADRAVAERSPVAVPG